MSILKLKKEFTFGSLINSILYVVLGVLILIALWFVLFLYNNFYLTISRAETVLILKSELAVDVLDVPLYEKIKKLMDAGDANEHADASASAASSTAALLPLGLANPFLPKQ